MRRSPQRRRKRAVPRRPGEPEVRKLQILAHPTCLRQRDVLIEEPAPGFNALGSPRQSRLSVHRNPPIDHITISISRVIHCRPCSRLSRVRLGITHSLDATWSLGPKSSGAHPHHVPATSFRGSHEHSICQDIRQVQVTQVVLCAAFISHKEAAQPSTSSRSTHSRTGSRVTAGTSTSDCSEYRQADLTSLGIEQVASRL